MLKAVARLMTGKGDDVAALQQQIQRLKREGQKASEEIDRLKRERASAASYEEATSIDDRVNRQIWACEHIAQLLPQLEVELAAARAAQQAQALIRHKKALIESYPKLRAAILAATDAQKFVTDSRAAAAQELGEAVVSLHLPAIQFAGFLVPDLVALWQQTSDRIIADLTGACRATRSFPGRRSGSGLGHIHQVRRRVAGWHDCRHWLPDRAAGPRRRDSLCWAALPIMCRHRRPRRIQPMAEGAPPNSAAQVPERSRAAGDPMRVCPECGRLYWSGSHVRRMQQRLAAWQQEAWGRGE
jgi:Mut7-C RNAse domain